MYTVRNKICTDCPNAFMHPPSTHALIQNAQTHAIGTAWILTNVAKLK
ncbi:190_t:CDS:1, partial [Diversispora eburnea]